MQYLIDMNIQSIPHSISHLLNDILVLAWRKSIVAIFIILAME
jgi:hypothetical protein